MAGAMRQDSREGARMLAVSNKKDGMLRGKRSTENYEWLLIAVQWMTAI